MGTAVTSRRLTIALVIVVALAVFASLGDAQGTRPQSGGILRVAIIGEPPTLDQQWTTAALTVDIMMHVFETLFALDKNYQPAPLLVSTYDVSRDGLVHTLTLRDDVLFHNGKPMTSEDVISSLRRWAKVQALGRGLFEYVENLEASGEHKVVFRLKKPLGTLPFQLARMGGAAAIYPKEVVDEAGEGQIKRFVGTGPFRFVQRIPDRFIKLARFPLYKPREEPTSGYAGRRIAYVDEITFIPTPEPAARIASLEAGEVDVADQIPPDAYARLRQNLRIQHLFAPWSWVAPFLNHKMGPFRDKRIRQAYALSIKAEPIMQAAYGDPAMYNIDASLMPKQTLWWTEDGCKEWYNRGDPTRARRLLQDAGYRGEPVRYLTTQEYHWAYNTAVVQKQQMEEAGFVVNLQVMDWATIIRLRVDPKNWEMLSNAHTAWGDPTGYSVLNPMQFGWWENARRDELVDQLRSRVAFKDRMTTWKQLQGVMCEEAALPKIADANVYRIASARVQGLLSLQEMPYWNAWIQR